MPSLGVVCHCGEGRRPPETLLLTGSASVDLPGPPEHQNLRPSVVTLLDCLSTLVVVLLFSLNLLDLERRLEVPH